MSFPTHDVAAMAGFFETYLGFTVSMNAQPEFCILKRPGLDVVIERASNAAATIKALAAGDGPGGFRDCIGEDGADAKWPIAFHIGLELPTVADVRALRDRLQADGFAAETGIFNNERGSRFFLRAPSGVLFEFNTRSDAAEAFRGTFDN